MAGVVEGVRLMTFLKKGAGVEEGEGVHLLPLMLVPVQTLTELEEGVVAMGGQL